ncbi:MAG: hypothetical protein Q7T03_08155 [Deltaproteobacteria bacterium]|nr:hypothetical protein [Deltaproteobacteria bacterium]
MKCKQVCHCEAQRAEAIPVLSGLLRRLRLLAMTCCLLQACGSGSVVEQLNNDSPSNLEAEGSSLNLSPDENVFAAAAFFSDPVGSIATIGLNSPHPVAKAKAVTDSSDVIVKSFGGILFTVNRGRTGTVQAINPETFKIVGNYSVGAGSNPQDLVVANGKAFITRLDSQLDANNKDDLFIVDPITGTLKASIDLKPFADNDGDSLARAAQMALVGDTLYILLQDLSKNFGATTEGKIVLVDTRTNTVIDADLTTTGVQAILLKGRNPTDIAYNSTLKKLFITDTGYFDSSFNNDVNTTYGGIEMVDPATNKTEGIIIDDKDFGGYLSTLRLVSDTLGVLTVNANIVATFNPTNKTVVNKNIYLSPGGFLPDLLVDKNGLLWVPERSSANSGLILLDPKAEIKIAGPFPVGAYPASMTLIR